MTLGSEMEALGSPSRPGSPATGAVPAEGAGKRAPLEPEAFANASEPDPNRSVTAGSQVEAARLRAKAAKEAAAKIRANASQYRIEPAPRPKSAMATLPSSDPMPAKRRTASKPKLPRGPVAPAPAAPAGMSPAPLAPTLEIQPRDAPTKQPGRGPVFPPKAATRTEARAAAAVVAAVVAAPPVAEGRIRFKPMRRTGTEPPPFKTAYRFRSAMGARSAGRLLIGEAQPIRPSRSHRAVAGSERPAGGEAVEALRALDRHQARSPAAGQRSRFDRLSQDIAGRQAWLGVDPETLDNGGVAEEVAPLSRWGRLSSWLFGSKPSPTD